MMTAYLIIGLVLVASYRCHKAHNMTMECYDVVLMENILSLLENSEERFDPEHLLPNWLERCFLIPFAFFVPVEKYFPPREFLERKYTGEDIRRVVTALAPHMRDAEKLSKRLSKREGAEYVRRIKKPRLRLVK
jgi:hypothetical protein